MKKKKKCVNYVLYGCLERGQERICFIHHMIYHGYQAVTMIKNSALCIQRRISGMVIFKKTKVGFVFPAQRTLKCHSVVCHRGR